MKFKIYGLMDPNTMEIRYIGQTCQPLNNRYKKHLNEKGKSYKCNWIKSLLSNGYTPNLVLIEECENKEMADFLEKKYIKEYKDNGFKLVNITEGGEGTVGFNHKESTKKLISQNKKEYYSYVENRNKMSKIKKEVWKNFSEKFKLDNIVNQINRKSICQYSISGDFIKEFLSMREIERELGFFRASISACLKGKYKSNISYGYIWKYIV